MSDRPKGRANQHPTKVCEVNFGGTEDDRVEAKIRDRCTRRRRGRIHIRHVTSELTGRHREDTIGQALGADRSLERVENGFLAFQGRILYLLQRPQAWVRHLLGPTQNAH